MNKLATTTAPSTRFQRWGPAFTLALAGLLFVLLRILHLRAILPSPLAQIPIIDSRFYLETARQLLAGQGFGGDPFFMSPLYSLWLAFAEIIGGEAIATALVLQSVLSAASMTLVYLLARRRFASRWSGPLAALLYALYAPALYFDAAPLSASLILLLTLLVLLLLDEAHRPAGRGRSFAAGLLLGLSALARPNALILVPLFGLYWIVAGRRRGLLRAGLLAAGVLLLTLPVALRNASTGGGFALTTNSAGVNLFIGNSDDATGLYTEMPWITSAEPWNEQEEFRQQAERIAGRPLSATQASRWWAGQAVRWMAGNPLEWLKLEARKFAWFFHRVEAPTNVSFYGARDLSPPLDKLSFVHFGLIAPLGLVGLVLFWRRRGTALPALLLAGYLLAGLLFFVASEYRYPILAVLLVYAAGALIELPRAYREGRLVPAMRASTLFLLLLLLCNAPWQRMRNLADPRSDYFNWASNALREGDPINSALLYHAALVHDPTWVEAQLQLGLVYEDMGLYDLAEKHLNAAGLPLHDISQRRQMLRGRRLQPGGDPALGDTLAIDRLVGLGVRFNQIGKHEAAFSVLNFVLQERDSTLQRARFERAFALEKLGRYKTATEEYMKLEKELPALPLLPYRAALAQYSAGNRGSALSTLRRVEKKARELADKEDRAQWLALLRRSHDLLQNFGPSPGDSPAFIPPSGWTGAGNDDVDKAKP